MKKRRFKGILCLLTLVACLACTGCKIVVGNSVYLENGRGRYITQ